MRRAFTLAAVLVFIAVSFGLSRESRVESEPAPGPVASVVLFTVPNLGIDDIDPSVMPTLSRLAGEGAIAATNVRTTGDGPNPLDAYASLGAGNRVGVAEEQIPGTDGAASTTTTSGAGPSMPGSTVTSVPETPLDETRPVIPTARQISASEAGLQPGSPDPIQVREMSTIIDLVDAGTDPGAQPGSLASALEAGGHRVAVVTNAGGPVPIDYSGAVVAPAAVAAANHRGIVDAGSVGSDLLRADPTRPGGATATAGSFATAVHEALDDADLVVVDPGETTRAATEADPADPVNAVASEQRRLDALAVTDTVLARIERSLPKDTLLIVVGITPPGQRWALTPMVIVGAGTPRGYLHSSSTHRPDLVTLTDLAPTILDALGTPVPTAMIGHPLAYRPGEANWNGALALDTLLERRAPIDRAMAVGFIVVQCVVYAAAVAVLAFRPPRPDWFDGVLLTAVLTCAAWPLATFALRAVPSLYSSGVVTFGLCWLVAAGVALSVSRLRRHTLDPVLALCAVTATVLVADLATGAHLQYGSFFGYAPTTAPRFTGIGNASFALLGGATVVICTALVARGRNRRDALWSAGAVAATVVIADGAPWMGADVGGILTLVPVLCLMMWSLSGRRVRWYTIALAVAAALGVLGTAVAIESLRDPAQRTHIGRFFLSSGEGSLFSDTLARKWSANTELLRRSPLAWAVPLLAGAGFVAVASGRAWRRVLPLGSPERTGVTATLAMGFVGFILNDSGVVVLALASVFLGPYVLLLAQAAERDVLPGAASTGTVGSPMAEEIEETGGDLEITGRTSPGEEPVGNAGDLVIDLTDQPSGVGPVVVALVPAKDREDSIADTVSALLGLGRVDRVVVIDDGSSDQTAEAARLAGADVVVLPRNRGKGGAVAAGVEATPDADVFLLIDADLARTAASADLLLDPVMAGDADLVIGMLPSAEGKGGFGLVRDMSARGIRRACGLEVRAPLSGQRAVRAGLIRDLVDAERFGLEVAMTIDVVRAGGRVIEVEVPMDHRHTGRSLAGFVHRGLQGRDIIRSLWPRVTSSRLRMALLVASTVVVCVLAPILGASQVPSTTALAARPGRVLVFGMQPLSFDDLERGVTPNLQHLIDTGATGALSARTVARTPTDGEGYLSLGAGARVSGGGLVETVLPMAEPVGGTTAQDYVASLTGTRPEGEFVVMGGPSIVRRTDDPDAAGTPGTLGDALAANRLTGVAIGNGDQPPTYTSSGYVNRPAALAVMTSDMGVPGGLIDPDRTLESSTSAPFGVQADSAAVVQGALRSLQDSAVVVVDPGDLGRAARFGKAAVSGAAEEMWERQLARSDEMLGRIVAAAPEDTMVMVVAVVPSGYPYRPTPLVMAGPGVPHGSITSPSTRQSGVSAITDLAPTILDALGVAPPAELPGSAVRFEAGEVDVARLRTLDRDTMVREKTYGPVSSRYIQAFTVVYGVLLVMMIGRRRSTGQAGLIRWVILTLAAFPVGTFLVRLVEPLNRASPWAQPGAALLVAGLLAAAAARSRRSSLSPLGWIAGLTVAVIVVDAWTGTTLHLSSWLGYSLHNAGRFYGIPNTTFAVLGACTVLVSGVIVHHSSRRTEALVKVACLFLVVLLSAGLPMLGADVGSLITLGPVFAVTLFAYTGRKVRLRNLALAALAMVVLVGGAAALDLSRPAEERSHLGRFAERVREDGPSAFVDTVVRKQEANTRLAQSSQWGRMVPIAGAFLFVPLVWHRRRKRLLPPGGPVTIAFWSVLGATALGYLSNDSGPIVVALFLAYLPPLIQILVMDDELGGPRFLPAASRAVTGP